MHQVYAPQRLKQRVLAAADCERVKQASPAPVRWKKMAMRVSAACCAVEIVVGGTALWHGSQNVSSGGTVSTQNTFGLAVYAAGKTHSNGNTVAICTNEDWSQYGGPGFSLDKKTGKYYRVSCYQPNLTCTGQNLKTVVYSIDTSALTKDQNLVIDRWADKNTVSCDANPVNSFTVDYKKGKVSDQLAPYHLRLKTMPTEAEEKRNADLEKKEMDAETLAWNTLKPITYGENNTTVTESYEDAQTLSKVRIVLRATFQDGSVQTQRYQLNPTVDFRKNMAAKMTFMMQLGMEDARKFPVDKRYAPADSISPEKKKFEDTILMPRALAFKDQHPLFTITKVNN